MERLTEMQSDGCYDLKDINGEWCNKYCEKQKAQTCKKCGIYQAIQKLAEYENSEVAFDVGRYVAMMQKDLEAELEKEIVKE